jgi:hypothetical protein
VEHAAEAQKTKEFLSYLFTGLAFYFTLMRERTKLTWQSA